MRTYSLPTAARIVAVETDNYRTKTITLDLTLDATPGQFVMVWLPRFDEKPFSLVNAAPVTLMITAVGPFTELVHALQVGDRLWVRGPLGHGFRCRAWPTTTGAGGRWLWRGAAALAGAPATGPHPGSVGVDRRPHRG